MLVLASEEPFPHMAGRLIARKLHKAVWNTSDSVGWAVPGRLLRSLVFWVGPGGFSPPYLHSIGLNLPYRTSFNR